MCIEKFYRMVDRTGYTIYQFRGAGSGSQDLLQVSGAGARASKNLLKTPPRSREPMPGSQAFLEPEPLKEIYKNISKELGTKRQAFFSGNQSQQPRAGSW